MSEASIEESNPPLGRELSSPTLYYWYRYAAPASFLGVALFDIAAQALHPSWMLGDSRFRGLSLLCSVIWFVAGRSLKRVYWHGDHLLVTDGTRSVEVGLHDIVEVPTPAYDYRPLIRVKLYSATPFGHSFRFVPRLGASRFVSAHPCPLADELRFAAATAQGVPPPVVAPPVPPRVMVTMVAVLSVIAIGIAVVMKGRDEDVAEVVGHHLQAVYSDRHEDAGAVLVPAVRTATPDAFGGVVIAAGINLGGTYYLDDEQVLFHSATCDIVIERPAGGHSRLRYTLWYVDDRWLVADVRPLYGRRRR